MRSTVEPAPPTRCWVACQRRADCMPEANLGGESALFEELSLSVSKYDIELTGGEGATSHNLMLSLVGANKRVLDVGCSTGYLAKALGERGNQVSGIEYDQASADKARPFLVDLVVGDLEAPEIFDSFVDSSFDVLVFGDVLEHLRDPLPVLRRADSRGSAGPPSCSAARASAGSPPSRARGQRRHLRAEHRARGRPALL